LSSFRRTKRGWHFVGSSWLRLGVLLVGGGAASVAAVFAYAKYLEPRWIQWRTVRLQLPGWPAALSGYRLVQLSDLHLAEGRGLTPHALRQICRQVNRRRPDCIVLTGDFVSALDETSLAGISELAVLSAPDGIYGVVGNHDYWTDERDVEDHVRAAGVKVLMNQHQRIGRRGGSFVLAGVDNIWEGRPDLDATLSGIADETTVILLAHEPNYGDIAVKDPRVVLQLSGHSHGGQVRIPWIGPLALPDLAFRYRVHRPGRAFYLYTNRGVGMAEIPFRLNCRPEITIFELYPE
jgi:predicted MPP superfamily phosphohydrolase